VQNNDLGGTKGYQGDSLYTAENPDYGAVIRYYVRDGFKSKKARRKEAEAKIKKDGGDVPIPSFDDLRTEEDEVAPRQYLEIMDEAGTVVARKELSTSAGLHKVTWNFRYEGLTPNSVRAGPMVAPGIYTAQAYRFEAGEATRLGEAVEFKVESIVEPTLPPQDRVKTIALVKEMGLFANRTYTATQKLNERLDDIRRLIDRIKQHPRGTAELLRQALKIQQQMEVYDRMLGGDELKEDRWVRTEPGINQRLQGALSRTMSGTYGPTRTSMEQWQIGKEQFKEIEADLLKLIGTEMDAFEKLVDKAEIPRTTLELEFESEED
jgi:hypothetical protein